MLFVLDDTKCWQKQIQSLKLCPWVFPGFLPPFAVKATAVPVTHSQPLDDSKTSSGQSWHSLRTGPPSIIQFSGVAQHQSGFSIWWELQSSLGYHLHLAILHQWRWFRIRRQLAISSSWTDSQWCIFDGCQISLSATSYSGQFQAGISSVRELLDRPPTFFPTTVANEKRGSASKRRDLHS